ncbi:MAG: LicD family protein, partial [Leucobacter sp.]
MMELSGSDGLVVEGIPPTAASVDFEFDGCRVWSVDLRGRARARVETFEIPTVLQPYLVGRTELAAVDSSDGTVYASAEVVFGDGDGRVAVLDEQGNRLSLNKWGRLAKTLERFSETVNPILERAEELVEVLRARGMRPFIVGGTLLGAVRDGALLPHDDDADIAYLSVHENPVDVAREHLELSRDLKKMGYRIVQHGAAHMQLHFVDDGTGANYYIDIFAAFFTPDGCINQPFHVRGTMREDQVLPFQEVAIGEFRFDAPADTERWFTINYDKDWRTPIPGYRLRTKWRTQRRFHNWFGRFNHNRDFWSDRFDGSDGVDPAVQRRWERLWREDADWIADRAELLRSPNLLELGSGRGDLAERLADGSRRVVASDYVVAELIGRSDAPGRAAGGAEFAHVNLMRLDALDAPRLLGFEGAFDVVANHVFEQLIGPGRENMLRLIRSACASGGVAIATLYGSPSPDVGPADPTGWHVEAGELAEQAAEFGLRVSTLPIEGGEGDSRWPYAAVFSLAPAEPPLRGAAPSPRRRLRQGLRRAKRAVAAWRLGR